MSNLFKGLSISVVIVFMLVWSGCCCPKKKVAKFELPTTTVAQAPEVKEAPPAPTPEVIEEKVLDIIYFDFDKYNLKPPAIEKLDKIADWISNNPGAKISIEGHCDERGTSEYNLALGERRANSAMKYLVNLGVTADSLSTVSYGEERPADPGHTEDAWAKNRRGEFKVVEK